MKQKTLITTMCLLLLVGNVLWAQDSTLYFRNLKTVEVSEKRATPNNLYPEIAEKGLSLSNFLDNNTGSLVKFNGPVGLNSVNLGGLGGQHTALNWNGVNLQSTMNGFSDLNLIPMFLFDQVGVSTDFGDLPLGGGIGGSLALNTYSARNEAFYSFGSFNNHRFGLALSPINTAKTKFGLRLFHGFGTNDFPYTDGFNNEKRLDNARMRQTHVMPSFSYKINQKSQITSEMWFTDATRELPPTLFEPESSASQDDQTLRFVTSYYHNVFNDNSSRNFSAKIAYTSESIVFNDEAKNLFGDNRSQNAYASVKQEFSKLNYVKDITTSLFLGGSAGINTARSLSFPELEPQSNAAVHARFQQHGFAERWLYNVNVKAETYMGQGNWSADGNLKYRFNEKVFLEAYGGRAYRFPTFNDLFWNPGGNPELETEVAYKGHLRLQTTVKKRTRLFAKVHSALVDNWIMWLPNVQNVWEAQNVKTVWARGLDLGLSESRYLFRRNFSWEINYAFMRAENRGGSAFINSGSQLSYVPYHKANFKLTYFSYRRWNVQWHHQIVGRRFINSDNSEWLPSYQLDNIRVNYFMGHLALSASLNNVFNQKYTSTATFPMPGRNFNLTVRYDFNRLFK